MMKKNNTTAPPRLGTSRAERLLAEADIEYAAVARCPVADCPVCSKTRLQAQAAA